MAALAARTAARRSIFGDGRDASVTSMDSNAAKFLEVDDDGEVGTADAGVSVIEDEDDGGTRTIGRGAAGGEDNGGSGGGGDCGSCVLKEALDDIR
jgi:hypothetical protein